MQQKVNNYAQEYIILCSQMCKNADDYTRENVKKHNEAMKKLYKLQSDLNEDTSLAECVYELLLKYEDAYVQQSAATDCLQLNIHIDTSLKILKKIKRSGDRMSSMEAKRTLLVYKGVLNPDEPF